MRVEAAKASISAGLSMALREHLRPGMTIAVGDGVGAIGTLDDSSSVGATLSATARDIGSVRLVLGWLPAAIDGIEADAFRAAVALMPGWGVRNVLQTPTARFIPTRLSAISALLCGPLRPDVLLTRFAERDGRLHFTTEVSWQQELVNAGVPILAIVDSTSPAASAEAPLAVDRVTVVGRSADGAAQLPSKPAEAVYEAVADGVLAFVPEDARMQYGPGQLGSALLARATRPLSLDTGLLTDAVVDLDRRGLLAGTPSATYLMGSDVLYEWADGRPILRGIGHTHDVARLSRGDPFVAVNTAIEIDPFGQVNVEGVGAKVVGGIGGHPDYCAAGAMSRRGLSIIAVPAEFNGRSPFVERLSRPASTPAYDVDVIVTERGAADLRGADWTTRRTLITDLFER